MYTQVRFKGLCSGHSAYLLPEFESLCNQTVKNSVRNILGLKESLLGLCCNGCSMVCLDHTGRGSIPCLPPTLVRISVRISVRNMLGLSCNGCMLTSDVSGRSSILCWPHQSKKQCKKHSVTRIIMRKVPLQDEKLLDNVNLFELETDARVCSSCNKSAFGGEGTPAVLEAPRPRCHQFKSDRRRTMVRNSKYKQ